MFSGGDREHLIEKPLSHSLLRVITSAEREVKDWRRSGMYQNCIFFDKIGQAKSAVFGSIRLFDEVRAELVRDILRSLRFL